MVMAAYRPNSEVVSTQLEEAESVLLNLETQQYYSLNETGSRIWELLKSGDDAQSIAASIAEEWDVTHQEALEHVRSFLQKLTDEGLVAQKN